MKWERIDSPHQEGSRIFAKSAARNSKAWHGKVRSLFSAWSLIIFQTVNGYSNLSPLYDFDWITMRQRVGNQRVDELLQVTSLETLCLIRLL